MLKEQDLRMTLGAALTQRIIAEAAGKPHEDWVGIAEFIVRYICPVNLWVGSNDIVAMAQVALKRMIARENDETLTLDECKQASDFAGEIDAFLRRNDLPTGD